MGRSPRIDVGNTIYHVLNRTTARIHVFRNSSEYSLFLHLLAETSCRFDMRVLAYCIMPNHWHLLLYPRNDGDLAKFMKYLTAVHTQKHHSLRKTIGTGHIYQGRYKSFPVTTDTYALQVCRYIERNPLRAGLVQRAEEWKWSSLRERTGRSPVDQIIENFPFPLPKKYMAWVNEKDGAILQKIRSEIVGLRGRPKKGA